MTLALQLNILTCVTSDYGKLARRIRTEGFMGIKAFFWADLCEGNNGEFKVYYGKAAPFQNW